MIEFAIEDEITMGFIMDPYILLFVGTQKKIILLTKNGNQISLTREVEIFFFFQFFNFFFFFLIIGIWNYCLFPLL